MIKAIDAHIHLDKYDEPFHLTDMNSEAVTLQAAQLVKGLATSPIKALIAVSMNQRSCLTVRRLQQQFPKQVFAAYGYHPEQELPSEAELNWICDFIRANRQEIVAIGEVGLPYYKRTEAEQTGQAFTIEPYCQLLEQFIQLSKEVNKPIVMHAVYEDADIACDLLEKHQVSAAHFHWFKGSDSTITRMIRNGYRVSITPDVLYEEEIQALVSKYPLELLMAETDGPWPFEGPFSGLMTHPRMVIDVIQRIAELKGLSIDETARTIFANTQQFYQLPWDGQE
ncbi:TatD family hydrolase [Brevibacillus ginsengisoli]|uniref:TatD family hydrolase n=1 Tax=Brevibacillus ginsengisoli TaxID=363854 RepID=UPI003CF4603C